MGFICKYCKKEAPSFEEAINCKCQNKKIYKKRRPLLIIIILTIICFILFVGVMIRMIKENGECVDNPFGYSAKKLKESGGFYSCSCSSLSPDLLDFSFDEDGIKIIKPTNYEDIDFSNIQVKGG